MSSLVYPSLPGLEWPQKRTVIPPPVKVRTTPSQREFRARDATLPRYRYRLQYEFLRAGARGSDLTTLVGFYNSVGGPFDSFLYSDPDDNAATAQQFGTGDGTTVAFQLLRGFGGFNEPVYDVTGTPLIYKAGLRQTSGYTISATGLVTFSSAPGSGQALTWTGSFYRRCRFLGDQMDTEKFMADLWRLGGVEFISVKG
jgi:uncharacterized protein (TIGR02217 family)